MLKLRTQGRTWAVIRRYGSKPSGNWGKMIPTPQRTNNAEKDLLKSSTALPDQFFQNTASKNDLTFKDLTSVSTMDTILNILDQAKLGSKKGEQAPPKNYQAVSLSDSEIKRLWDIDLFQKPPGLFVGLSDKHDATNIDKIGKSIPKFGRKGIRFERDNQPVLSAFQTEDARILGQKVIKWCVRKYIDTRILPLKKGQFSNQDQADMEDIIVAQYERDPLNKYTVKDSQYTNNGQLKLHEALSMHFYRRPLEVLNFVALDIEKVVKTLTSVDQFLVRLEKEKINLEFPDFGINDTEYSMFSPIGDKSSTQGDNLIKIPFIINDKSLLEHLFPTFTPAIRAGLGVTMTRFSSEGESLLNLFIRRQLLVKYPQGGHHNKKEVESIVPDVVKANVVVKSDLFSTDYKLATDSITHYGGTRTSTSATRFLRTSFNLYMAVWFRADAETALNWTQWMVKNRVNYKLNESELNELSEECFQYFEKRSRTKRNEEIEQLSKELLGPARNRVRQHA